MYNQLSIVLRKCTCIPLSFGEPNEKTSVTLLMNKSKVLHL